MRSKFFADQTNSSILRSTLFNKITQIFCSTKRAILFSNEVKFVDAQCLKVQNGWVLIFFWQIFLRESQGDPYFPFFTKFFKTYPSPLCIINSISERPCHYFMGHYFTYILQLQRVNFVLFFRSKTYLRSNGTDY